MKNLRIKLFNNKGESLVEALAAILISSLAMLMLATAVGSATNMVVSSREKITRYYSGDNALVEQSASGIEGTAKLEVAGGGGTTTNLLPTAPSGKGNVIIFKNSEATFLGPGASEKQVNSYRWKEETS